MSGRSDRARSAGRSRESFPRAWRPWWRQLRAGPEAGAEARWFLGEVLWDRRTEVRFHLAALLIAEVATNAASHGSPRTGSPIDVTITARDRVHVSVRDRGSGFDPQHEIAHARGWGVRIVAALARDRGVECAPEGTEVWFEV